MEKKESVKFQRTENGEPYSLSEEKYHYKKILEVSHNPGVPGYNLLTLGNIVTEHNGYYYMIIIDHENNRPKVIKVDMKDTSNVEYGYIEGSDYTPRADSHHHFTMEIDCNGYLHVVGDMHNYQNTPGNIERTQDHLPERLKGQHILYWRTTIPEDLESFQFYGDDPLHSPQGYGFTYPNLHKDNDGKIYLTARTQVGGHVGKMNNRGTGLTRLNPETWKWEIYGDYPAFEDNSAATKKVLAYEIFSEVDTTSYTKSIGDIAFDRENRLHFTTPLNTDSENNYREIAESNGINMYHWNTDIAYMRSDERKNSFVKADGGQVALPGRVKAGEQQCDIVFTRDDPDGIAILGNQTHVTTDRSNNPIVGFSQDSLRSHNEWVNGFTMAHWKDEEWKIYTALGGGGELDIDCRTILSDYNGAITFMSKGKPRFWRMWDPAGKVYEVKPAGLDHVVDRINKSYFRLTGNMLGHTYDSIKGVIIFYMIEIERPDIIAEPEYNITPKAVITGPNIGFTGDVLVFQGGDSSDPDGKITEYIWSLDGVEAGRDESHVLTLQEAKSYILTLKVLDDMDGYNIMEKVITIIPPVRDIFAVIKAPLLGKAGEGIVFDGSISETSDGEIVDYIWEAEGTKSSGNSVEEFIFAETGMHQVKLTVVNSYGNENTSIFNIQIMGEEVSNLNYTLEGREGVLEEGDVINYKDVTLVFEDGTDAVSYVLNNGESTPIGNTSWVDIQLMEGSNTLNVMDEPGQMGTLITIEVNTTPPKYQVYGESGILENGALIDYSQVRLEVFKESAEYCLNGGQWILLEEERETVLELISGENTIQIRDCLGNAGEIFRVSVEEVAERPEDTERVASKAVAVWRGEPDNNMLDKVNVYIWGTTGINSNRISYLEFDLADIRNANYDEVKLSLYIKGKAGVELNFYGSETYTDWEENTLTWNNSKYHEADFSRIVIEDDIVHILDHEFAEDMVSHEYVEFDVTNCVRGVSGDRVIFIITNNRLDGNQGVHFKPLRNIDQEPTLKFKNIGV